MSFTATDVAVPMIYNYWFWLVFFFFCLLLMMFFLSARKAISLVCILCLSLDESKGRMGINSALIVVLFTMWMFRLFSDKFS